MIVDQKHRPWMYGCSAAALLAAILYAISLSFSPNGARGNTAWGLGFGYAGTLVILFECLLSLRKRFPASPFGRMTTWLRAHIWLGLLSFLLILFHSGWHWGRGVAGVSMWVFLFITLSGILGMFLQNYLPRRLTELVPRETVYEQIPLVVRELRDEADERVEFVTADLAIEEEDEQVEADPFRAGGIKFHFDSEQRQSAREKIDAEIARRKAQPQIQVDAQFTEALKLKYLQEIRPFLEARPLEHSEHTFRSVAAVVAYFKHFRTLMPPPIHDVIGDLEDIVEERRQLILQARIHFWLHAWLLVHVPFSAAFLVLIAAHAIGSLRY